MIISFICSEFHLLNNSDYPSNVFYGKNTVKWVFPRPFIKQLLLSYNDARFVFIAKLYSSLGKILRTQFVTL